MDFPEFESKRNLRNHITNVRKLIKAARNNSLENEIKFHLNGITFYSSAKITFCFHDRNNPERSLLTDEQINDISIIIATHIKNNLAQKSIDILNPIITLNHV